MTSTNDNVTDQHEPERPEPFTELLIRTLIRAGSGRLDDLQREFADALTSGEIAERARIGLDDIPTAEYDPTLALPQLDSLEEIPHPWTGETQHTLSTPFPENAAHELDSKMLGLRSEFLTFFGELLCALRDFEAALGPAPSDSVEDYAERLRVEPIPNPTVSPDRLIEMNAQLLNLTNAFTSAKNQLSLQGGHAQLAMMESYGLPLLMRVYAVLHRYNPDLRDGDHGLDIGDN